MIIYQIRSLIDGKIYIGKTVNLKRRWQGHLSLVKTGKGYWIHNAIRKYGVENFVVEVIKENATNEDEKELIEKYREISYNIHIGGLGGDNITFHPNKREIFEKRRAKHLENVPRGEKHPRWVSVSVEDKKLIVEEYFSYGLTSPESICKKFNISKDIFDRVIRENNKLFRSKIDRFYYNKENIKRLIDEYTIYSIDEICKRGCGLSYGVISKVLQSNGVVIKRKDR
jgi:group I intron endonuclease